nr:hypothetical protein [Tanacetum cinerariifolium]
DPTAACGACFKCGGADHYKSACPKLNRAQGPGVNRLNQALAIDGGQCHENNGIEPSDLGFSYEIEIASGQLVEIDKAWIGYLTTRLKLICHEKVVRIPLLDGNVLRVLGERPEEKARHLMCAKAKEQKQEEMVVRVEQVDHQDCYPLSRIDDLFDQLQGSQYFSKIDLRKVRPFIEVRNRKREFQTLKDKLCNAYVLAILDGPKDFVVYCDASSLGLDYVLMQRGKVITYAFRQLKIHEKNYTTRDLELELFSNCDCEICYHPGKENVVADALSRKERIKPKRIRSMNMTLQSSVKGKILVAQKEASDEFAGLLRGLDEMIERSQRWGLVLHGLNIGFFEGCLTYLKVKAKHQSSSGLLQQPKILEWKWKRIAMDFDYKMDRLARLYLNVIVARHDVQISIISDRDSGFTSRKCRSLIMWAKVGEGQLISPELVQETTEKILQIKDRLKAARDSQKSYPNKRRKPLEFSVGEYVLLKVSPWKGVVRFRKKGNVAPSLPLEWSTHVVVWMNKANIETMSIDDLYNNFKIIEHDVKKSVGASTGAQNMAFMSAPSTNSTNDVNTANPAYKASTVNPNVNTASPQVSTANFSDNAVYAFMVENHNGSNLLQQDLEQIHEDDLEAMDLRWQLSLQKNAELKGTKMVGSGIKTTLGSNETMKIHLQKQCWLYMVSVLTGVIWKKNRGLATVEEQLITYKKNKVLFSEEVGVLKREVSCKDYEINVLKKPEFKGYGPRDSKLQSNINHDKKADDSKEIYDDSFVKEQVSDETSSFVESPLNVDKETAFSVDKKIEFVKPKNHDKTVRKSVRKRRVSRNNYNMEDYNYYAKTTHHSAQRNMTPRAVLLRTGLGPFNTARPVYTGHPKPTANTARPSVVKTARPYITPVNTVRAKRFNDVKASACWVWRPSRPNGASLVFKRHNYIDARGRSNGCSRHMTGNIPYLSDFKEFDDGYVTYGGGAHGGRIFGKGTFKTDSLDFQDILLKIPKKDNMYSFDMKNIVPKKSLTCLVTKATLDELLLWHKRLGHINFKNINKLVKDNLVRGLPLKRFENDQTCFSCLKGKQHRASSPKDETSEIPKDFIKEIENLVDKKVKIFRCDNGTEFKNKVMDDFCREKVAAGKILDESAGTQGDLNAGTSSRKEAISQDYVVIWKDASYFDSPSNDVKDGPHNEDDVKDKSEDDSSPKEVNTAGVGFDTRPPMLDRSDFDYWQQRIRLYCLVKDNGENILQSIDEGLFKMGKFRETLANSVLCPEQDRVVKDLTPEEKERYKADIRVTNILLQGLPKDIYTLINYYTDAKDIWDNVKMLLEGSELTKDERES